MLDRVLRKDIEDLLEEGFTNTPRQTELKELFRRILDDDDHERNGQPD
jgi:hypothetical protein